MSDGIIESPILRFGDRSAVAFKGRMMFHSTAARLKEHSGPMREMSARGMSATQTARKLGFSVVTVKRWSTILGIPFRKERNRRGKSYDKTGWEQAILDGVASGMTQGQVAVRLGVPIVNVHRFCVDNGINWKNLKANAKANR